jgi:DNA-binding MarR family transcriptional regulator
MVARRQSEARAVADSVVELVQTVRSSKARALAAARTDLDSAAPLLLRTIDQHGPQRASDLAECLHLDLSTVSRQTSALVDRGLLERRADPDDGRASLLGLTDAGCAVLARHAEARQAFFAEVLTGWKVDDLHDFAALLARFTTDYQQAQHSWAERSKGSTTP